MGARGGDTPCAHLFPSACYAGYPSARFENVLFLFQAKGVIIAERLEHWICNPEAPSSTPAQTASLSSFFPGAPIKIYKQAISFW